MKVEMAQSVCGDQGVRVDQEGHDADESEDDEEGEGDHRDGALHQMPVGGVRRLEGDGSKESEEKGEQRIYPPVFFLLQDDRHGKEEDNQDHQSNKRNAVVAEKGKCDGEGSKAEDNVGKKVG